MRVIVLGGTRFVGRRIVERLHERGDDVLVVHRGHRWPRPWIAVHHLITDRRELTRHTDEIRRFGADAVVDTIALSGADVDALVPALPDVPSVVLSSQDVYAAFGGLRTGRHVADIPLDENSAVRSDRYLYRGLDIDGVPDDYEKLDVEKAWLERGAVVLRLPLVYGPHDWQRREEFVLRRLRAGRASIPVGEGTLLWTRGHVDDLATGVLAALDTRAADGMVVNLGEPRVESFDWWMRQIVAAAGSPSRLVRVPDETLPADLALTAAATQHLLVSVARAEALLGWAPDDPATRIAESVHWHLEHPPGDAGWSEDDARADDAALAAAQ